MMQNAEPIGHEEEISVSKDTVISDEWPSRPADCVSSPRSTSVFGLKGTRRYWNGDQNSGGTVEDKSSSVRDGTGGREPTINGP